MMKKPAPKLTSELVHVTPAIAEQWLNMNRSNRTLRSGVVEQYAADMLADKWTQCLMPIGFYADGELADGQHRLYAIIESGTSQWFTVTRGLDRPSGLNIDTNLPRNVVDSAQISGVSAGLSGQLLSTARAVATGMGSARGRQSNSTKVEMVEQFREACEWAVAHGGHARNISNSVLYGALARAWYWEKDKELLARFAKVICTGYSDGPAESAAIAMRNYLIEHAGTASGSALWRDTFLKMMNAIHYFMRRKPLTVIRGVKDEAYELREEPVMSAAVAKRATAKKQPALKRVA
jgi:hypothetical protein